MKIIITKPHWQVIALGILAGMRTMAAPAIASKMLGQHHSKKLQHSPLSFMQSGTTAKVLSVMALGEFVGDKMPSAPNRIATPGLVFRSLSGAVAGASIYKASGGNIYAGALLGGVTAVAATFGSFFLRKAIVKQAHLIDPVIGGIEDAIVLGAGIGLAESM
ncbi:MAG: DUF4126 family protein [Bacteroidota bacterium]